MNANLPHSSGASELEREASDAPGATAGYESLNVAAPAEAVGSVIAGKYKLLQEIGEGGMGSVFMADQTHPARGFVILGLNLRVDSELHRSNFILVTPAAFRR